MKPLGRLARALAFAFALACASSAGTAHADGAEWGFSPGIKLGYTPGHGVTYGLELSIIRVPDLLSTHSGSVVHDLVGSGVIAITRTWGMVFNLDTTFHGLLRLRAGAEWVGPFIGLESGPTFVRDREGRHFGIGLTAWAGYDLFAYFTRTFVVGGQNLSDFGLYLKTPLLAFDRGSHIDFDDDN